MNRWCNDTFILGGRIRCDRGMSMGCKGGKEEEEKEIFQGSAVETCKS